MNVRILTGFFGRIWLLLGFVGIESATQAFQLLHLILVAFRIILIVWLSGDDWMQWIGPSETSKTDNTKVRSI